MLETLKSAKYNKVFHQYDKFHYTCCAFALDDKWNLVEIFKIYKIK